MDFKDLAAKVEAEAKELGEKVEEKAQDCKDAKC